MSNVAALPVSIPGASNVHLPQKYEAARNAIAECARVDECKDWADKAAALAAYARQAKDDSLAVYARRIQARALRRAGELLKLVPRGDVSTRFGQENEQPHGQAGTLPPVETRTQAAQQAGLSDHQRKQALRIAAVPTEDFDYAVESQEPATVTELADMGTQTRVVPSEPVVGIDPAAAMATAELVRKFAECCESTDPIEVGRALPQANARQIQAQVAIIDRWLDRIVSYLAGV